MNRYRHSIPALLVLFSVILLCGCGGGSGGDNGPVVPVPPAGSPSKPLNLIAVSGDGQASISWNTVSSATTYTLYWGTSPGISTSSTKISGLTTTSYTHTGLTNSTAYYYRLTASNSSGESLQSDETSTTPLGNPPTSPQNVSATPGASLASITWGSVPTATSYTLYWTRSPNLAASAATKITGITGVSYSHTGLAATGTYYYRVSANNTFGESALSTEVTVTLVQGMTLTITSPTNGAVTDTPIKIIANPVSTYEISSVLVKLEDYTYPLIYDTCATSGRIGCTAGWTVTVPLTGMSRGSHTLVVTATNANSSSVTASTSFVYDQKPVLSVTNPLDSAVVRSSVLRVVASCSDDDTAGCASISAYANGTLLGTTLGNMDQTYTLSAADGTSVTIRIDSVDSLAQKTSITRTVLIETLSGMTPVATVNGDIKDFTADRILYDDSTTGTASLKIRNITAGTDTLVASDPLTTPQAGSLTPSGAMYVMKASSEVYGKLYDFSGGTSEMQGFPESTFKIAGNYAMWFGYDVAGSTEYLYRRDFTTGITTGLLKYIYFSSANPAKSNNDVAANGDVLYYTTDTFDTNIIRIRNSVSTRITNNLGASSGIPLWYQNRSPKTDGTNVCYTKQEYRNPGGAGTTSLYLYNGTQEILLSAPFDSSSGSTASFQYEVNNGWVAYSKPGTTNQSQVWLMSANGTAAQVTFFSNSSSIVALASNGEIIIFNGGRLYLYKPGQSGLRDVASTMARPKYLEGSWYYIVGRTLFR